jgi:hypothetical protein
MSMGFGFSLPAYTGYAASFGAGATLALDFTSGNQTLDPASLSHAQPQPPAPTLVA